MVVSTMFNDVEKPIKWYISSRDLFRGFKSLRSLHFDYQQVRFQNWKVTTPSYNKSKFHYVCSSRLKLFFWSEIISSKDGFSGSRKIIRTNEISQQDPSSPFLRSDVQNAFLVKYCGFYALDEANFGTVHPARLTGQTQGGQSISPF